MENTKKAPDDIHMVALIEAIRDWDKDWEAYCNKETHIAPKDINSFAKELMEHFTVQPARPAKPNTSWFEEASKECDKKFEEAEQGLHRSGCSTHYLANEVKVDNEKQAPPHYDNTNGSLYKFCEEQGLNAYEFDILKRVIRCRKKGNFLEDLEKTKFLIDLYIKESK